MTTLYLEVFAADRGRELRQEAAASRLAAVVRCCKPSAWARAARRVATAVAARRTAATPCCA